MKEYKNKNGGFTLPEVLCIVAIMVILMAFGAAGIVRYRNYLKITEWDNMAREIYMAAQNRAVLLQNSGRLREELKNAGKELPAGIAAGVSEGTVYITWEGKNDDKLEELLPTGTIDPALRTGQFYIVYEPVTGSVTDVFFVEKDNKLPEIEDAFNRADEKNRELRMDSPMFGWYHGEVEDLTDMKILPTPGVEIIIENREELTLTVRYTLPDLPAGVSLSDEAGKVKLKREPIVRLKYKDETFLLLANPGEFVSPRSPEQGSGDIIFGSVAAGTPVSYTWVLDSLKKDDDGNFEKQFRGLITGITGGFGGDFSVTAGLTLTADGYIDSAYYVEAADNSLFAKGSTYNTVDGTAEIEYLRHLQNLNTQHSGVDAGIINAEQIANINCAASRKNDGTVLESQYNFIPVVNNNLKSYDGKQKNISNLYVNSNGEAGLFKSIEKADVKGVRLIDAAVKGTNAAGTLVGVAKADTTFTDCRVYWSDSDKLITAAPKQIDCKVSGNNAGGLIGNASGAVTITNSFAATTVKGKDNAGGLIGSASGTVTIANSYADCYLNGDAKVGGLIGRSTSGNLTVKDCYAAGFSMATAAGTAGLVNGNVNNPANIYSVVRVLNADGTWGEPGTLLYDGAPDTDPGVYYLHKTTEVTPNDFGNAFEYVNEDNSPETHVYDLRYRLGNSTDENLKLTPPYPYPGLKNLPHYGDWVEMDPPVGFVYYEIYNDGTCGVNGIGLDDSLKAGIVRKDGYALVFRKDKTPVDDTYTVKYGTGGNARNLTLTWGEIVSTITRDGNDYVLISLPDEVITGEAPDRTRFWQEIVCGMYNGGKTFYFNPHFAKTVREGMRPAEPANAKEDAVSVRTPRHFYSLSRFQDKGKNKVYAAIGCYFLQELNLDYTVYTGYGIFTENGAGLCFVQDPIGLARDDIGFMGTYDGDGHVVQNVFYDTAKDFAYFGLFGYADKGTLKNITYRVSPGSSQSVIKTNGNNTHGAYVGTLVGHIDIMEKCYAEINGSLTVSESGAGTNIYAGGLAGFTNKKVENCGVKINALNVTGTGIDLFGGGLVGRVAEGSTVSNCTAGLNSLSVSGSGQYVYGGGLTGYTGGNMTLCEVDVKESLTVRVTGNCAGLQNVYGGGLTGGTSDGISGCTVKAGSATLRVEGKGENAGYADGGGLAGYANKSVENCSVEINGLHVIGAGDLIHGGGLVGWTNEFVKDCKSITIKGELSVEGTGKNRTNTYGGGLAGLISGNTSGCTVQAGKLNITGTGNDVYGGGLIGRTYNSVESCVTEISSFAISGTKKWTEEEKAKAKEDTDYKLPAIVIYGGGLAGHVSSLTGCKATVEESVKVDGTESDANVYGGGLAGGAAWGATSCNAEVCSLSVMGAGEFIRGGGLVGNVDNNAQVLQSIAMLKEMEVIGKGTLSNTYGGGLVGSAGILLNSAAGVNLLSVSGPGAGKGTNIYAGGLAGLIGVSVERCSSGANRLNVTGGSEYIYAGGLVGRIDGTITYSHAAGRIFGKCVHGGGLVGYITGNIADCYAVVDVTQLTSTNRGGLTGTLSGTSTINRGHWFSGTFYYPGDTQYTMNGAGLNDSGRGIAWSNVTFWGTFDMGSVPASRTYVGKWADPYYTGKPYPYPVGVVNGSWEQVYYGQWPIPVR